MIRTVAVMAMCLWAEMAPLTPPQANLTFRVFTPATVMFQVLDVNSTTHASSATTVSFDSGNLRGGQALRISVKADGDIVMPGGATIAATNVGWTATGATNGVGVNGELNKLTYTTVFEGQIGATTGQVALSWTLAAPGPSVTGGTGQLTLRWRFEPVRP